MSYNTQRSKRPANSELYQYPVYGYDGGEKSEHFRDLDVTRCPRCDDQDIYPGERVCSRCLSEINADDYE